MSTITLNAPNADLLGFCSAVIELDNAGILAATMRPLLDGPTIAAPVPAPKTVRTPKAPARKKAAAVTDFWNGPATRSQIKRNTDFAQRNGFPVLDMTGWTAKEASEDLKSMKADLGE